MPRPEGPSDYVESLRIVFAKTRRATWLSAIFTTIAPMIEIFGVIAATSSCEPSSLTRRSRRDPRRCPLILILLLIKKTPQVANLFRLVVKAWLPPDSDPCIPLAIRSPERRPTEHSPERPRRKREGGCIQCRGEAQNPPSRGLVAGSLDPALRRRIWCSTCSCVARIASQYAGCPAHGQRAVRSLAGGKFVTLRIPIRSAST